MMLDRSPVSKDALVDKHGNPALGVDLEGRNISWVRPLSDPLGGTDASYGRHQAKMNEPDPPSNAPDYVVQLFWVRFSSQTRVSGFTDTQIS